MAMGKGQGRVLVAVAIVLAALVAWTLRGGEVAVETFDAAMPGAAPMVETAASAEVDRDGNRPAAAAVSMASPVERVDVSIAPVAAPTCIVRGRCVAAENGQPLAGCRLTWGVEGEPRDLVTGGDGRFELALTPEGYFGLLIDGPGRARRGETWRLPAAGQVEDLGDVLMERGFEVRGTVVDADGAPLVDVGVLVWSCRRAIRNRNGASSNASVQTDHEGAFVCQGLLPGGVWRIGCESSQHEFEIDPGTGTAPLRIVVPVRRFISGIIVDDTGSPVAGVALGDKELAELRTTSDSAGRFQLRDWSLTKRPTARIAISDPGPCEPDRTEREVAWGTSDLRLQLVRAGRVQVEVVDPDGRPVEDYCVLLMRTDQPVGVEHQVRAEGEHENGIAVVQPARRGANHLQVFPRARSLLASETIEVQVGADGLARARVVLRRARACPVVVVDASGEPVCGAGLRLIAGLDDRHDPWDPRSRLGYRSSNMLVDDATTDASGRAELFAPEIVTGHILQVRSRHLPLTIHDPALSPSTPLRIELALAGEITGTVRLNGQPRDWISVWIAAPGASTSQRRRAFVQPDGTFACDRLLPGPYQVTLLRSLGGPGGSSIPVPGQVRDVNVAAGATVRFELDAGEAPAARLHGRLRIDGAPPRGWQVKLVYPDLGGAARGMFAVDEAGSFTATELVAGRCRVVVHLPGGNQLWLPDPVAVGEGSTVEHDFPFVRRRLVLRMQNPDGTPFTDMVRIKHDSYWNVLRGPDAVLDPAPLVPFAISRHNYGSPEIVTITMPTDRLEHEVVVTVPPAKPQ